MASPKNATYSQLCKMHRDHTEVGDWCLMTDTDVVWISQQKIGEDRTQHIEIPRAVFNRLLVWYQHEVKR